MGVRGHPLKSELNPYTGGTVGSAIDVLEKLLSNEQQQMLELEPLEECWRAAAVKWRIHLIPGIFVCNKPSTSWLLK